MEGHCSIGQNPQWAVVPMAEEEEAEEEEEEEEEGEDPGKNGKRKQKEILFDRPKTTVGCSVNGGGG